MVSNAYYILIKLCILMIYFLIKKFHKMKLYVNKFYEFLILFSIVYQIVQPCIVRASDIRNITKNSFISEIDEGKAERIFFRICFCSTIAYARSLMLVPIVTVTRCNFFATCNAILLLRDVNL